MIVRGSPSELETVRINKATAGVHQCTGHTYQWVDVLNYPMDLKMTEASNYDYENTFNTESDTILYPFIYLSIILN